MTTITKGKLLKGDRVEIEYTQRYEKLLMLSNNLRRAHWDFRNYGGKSYCQKERIAGAELDKFLREENNRVLLVKKELLP